MTAENIIFFLLLLLPKNVPSKRHGSKSPVAGSASYRSFSRIDVANAKRKASCACNSTLMITCWLAAVYLLSSYPALCCVIEFG